MPCSQRWLASAEVFIAKDDSNIGCLLARLSEAFIEVETALGFRRPVLPGKSTATMQRAAER